TVLHESLFMAGQLGRKTGRGFHDYGEAKSASPAAGGEDPGAPPGGEPGGAPVTAWIAGEAQELGRTIASGVRLAAADQAEVLLVSPMAGEDVATAAARLRLDPARAVAVDFLGMEKGFLTLMAPVGGDGTARKLAAFLRGTGLSVAVIKDSPGFVAPRILAMIVNLACEIAQMDIGTPADIDVAMRLAQNYPRGPFEWGEWLGPRRVHDTLRQIQEITGSDRYRPSLWLRRRALLSLPLRTRE